MRLWTLHPRYLDRMGLLALWREALGAQQVLLGRTRGYRHHPQLTRFRAHVDPVGAIGSYLQGVYEEAGRRAYSFDAAKINPRRTATTIPATTGQLVYEWAHLQRKLRDRDPARLEALPAVARPDPHPLFTVVPGDVAAWEVGYWRA
jgi:hypothetical protein